MAILLVIRTIIRPDKRQIKLNIPKEYIGIEIEVTYLPLKEVTKPVNLSQRTMKDFWNVLSDEGAEKLRDRVVNSRDE